ncbi:hypothetical protein BEP19_06820 [Ammoniphilus oxalaticus]|uniref:Cell division protein n=1 Tax=Ammoniphilus oxalaticus TaxID=66863 RepID=A0A419SJG1_9BACL|nr:YggT family protein [Ammoniphilus oxalaticus]RKD24115.1 hypothetical protein BEP19_06820 [Ammoniphilus oxalaticus]
MSPTIETVIRTIVQVYTFIIFGYILSSWFPRLRDSALGYFLGKMAEPFLSPFRQLIRPVGVMDISAIVALFTLFFAEKGLIFLLYYFF